MAVVLFCCPLGDCCNESVVVVLTFHLFSSANKMEVSEMVLTYLVFVIFL